MSLTRTLLQTLATSRGVVTSEVDEAAVEAALGRLVAEASTAWPDLSVDAHAFITYVAQRITPQPELIPAIAALHGAELYLAFACACGDQRAMTTLERAYGEHIEAVLRGMQGRGLTREDFRQIVRRKLFVSDPGQPAKIATYSGSGSLAAWLRITARRAGLNAIRGQEVVADSSEDLFDLPQSLGDPELDYLKEKYREEFKEAFLEAVAGLGARERTLLRQTIAHGLTVRQIGRMYQVHHATAARWIAAAREQLTEGTRASLQQRLEVSQRELESIMGMIASRLDVSVVRVLGTGDASD